MGVVVKDLIEGDGLEITKDGYVHTRAFIVSGVKGPTTSRAATAAAHGGIPKYGEPHPSIADLEVSHISVKPADNSHETFIVTATYKEQQIENMPVDDTAPPQINIGASLQTAQTNKNRHGSLMTVRYTFEDEDENGGTIQRTVEGTGTVEKQVPIANFTFTRRESQSPWIKSLRYTGTVDLRTQRWMCLGIHGDRQPDGTYVVTYEMQYNRDTWTVEVAYIDPETQDHPPDISKDNGIKRYEIYPLESFELLNINLYNNDLGEEQLIDAVF